MNWDLFVAEARLLGLLFYAHDAIARDHGPEAAHAFLKAFLEHSHG